MRELKHDENLSDLIHAFELCIIEYGDEENCPPCTALKRRIDEWIETYENVCGLFVPISEFRQLCAQKGILSIPCVEIYIDGRLVLKNAGYFSLDQMLSRTEELLALRQTESDDQI